MIRLEVIPYENLDEQLDKAIKLRKLENQHKFKSFHDLGGFFIIEHFTGTYEIRI